MIQQTTNTHLLSSSVRSLSAFGEYAGSFASLAERFEPLVLMSAFSGRVLSSVCPDNRIQNQKKMRSALFQHNNPSQTDARPSAAPEQKTKNFHPELVEGQKPKTK